MGMKSENIFCPEQKSFMFNKNNRGYINPFSSVSISSITQIFLSFCSTGRCDEKEKGLGIQTNMASQLGSTTIRCVNWIISNWVQCKNNQIAMLRGFFDETVDNVGMKIDFPPWVL